MSVRTEAILVSSVVIGNGSLSEAALNLMVPLVGEKAIADRSRARCVSNTDASFSLSASAPMLDAKVETKRSRENMREVLEVAVVEALSSTALAAA